MQKILILAVFGCSIVLAQSANPLAFLVASSTPGTAMACKVAGSTVCNLTFTFNANTGSVGAGRSNLNSDGALYPVGPAIAGVSGYARMQFDGEGHGKRRKRSRCAILFRYADGRKFHFHAACAQRNRLGILLVSRPSPEISSGHEEDRRKVA
jgi:hypothetical protein